MGAAEQGQDLGSSSWNLATKGHMEPERMRTLPAATGKGDYCLSVDSSWLWIVLDTNCEKWRQNLFPLLEGNERVRQQASPSFSVFPVRYNPVKYILKEDSCDIQIQHSLSQLYFIYLIACSFSPLSSSRKTAWRISRAIRVLVEKQFEKGT